MEELKELGEAMKDDHLNEPPIVPNFSPLEDPIVLMYKCIFS